MSIYCSITQYLIYTKFLTSLPNEALVFFLESLLNFMLYKNSLLS